MARAICILTGYFRAFGVVRLRVNTQGTVDAGSLKMTKCWNNSVGQATSLKNMDRTGPYGAFFRPTTKKESGCLTISGEFSGLPPGKHGLQVHCFGDVSNDWISAGPLYNPYNKTNGAQEENRYAAGLGVNVNEDGLAKLDVQVSHLHLTGIHSIIGRTLVIHQSEDEPGKSDKEDSIMAGSDGSAVAWGVIGICQSNIPEDYLEEKN